MLELLSTRASDIRRLSGARLIDIQPDSELASIPESRLPPTGLVFGTDLNHRRTISSQEDASISGTRQTALDR